jgi:prepilin-type N-terminal cleavage/methylation domain-containing protein
MPRGIGRIEMKQDIEPRRIESGFTLVETLVAIALLAVVLLAMAPLFLSGLKLNSGASDKTSANTLAKEALEEALLLPSGDTTYLRMGTGSKCYTSDPRCAGGAGSIGCPCPSGVTMTQVTPGTAVNGGATLPQLAPRFVYASSGSTTGVPNPYTIFYTVQEFAFIPGTPGNPPTLGSQLTAGATQSYDVKRVDVYVNSSKNGLFGLRGVTVTGFIRNTYFDPNNPGF